MRTGPFRECCRDLRIRELAMNRYGAMAQHHWARWLPARYAAVGDPGSFFSDLGSQAETRISALAAELAGDDQPGEGFLAKAGRLGEARHRAEQIVLSEDIFLKPEPGASEDEESPRQDQPWGLELLQAEDPEEG